MRRKREWWKYQIGSTGGGKCEGLGSMSRVVKQCFPKSKVCKVQER